MGVAGYLVKPFPSTLTTIQQCGSKLSSASKFFTYSKRLFAMHACRTMLAGPTFCKAQAPLNLPGLQCA